MTKTAKPRRFFSTGSQVRLAGEDVRGIVARTTFKQAYVEWVGYDWPPSADGWYPHSKLRPKTAKKTR